MRDISEYGRVFCCLNATHRIQQESIMMYLSLKNWGSYVQDLYVIKYEDCHAKVLEVRRHVMYHAKLVRFCWCKNFFA
jgi:Herpesviridae UL52/UL70 DNA primase